MSSPNCEPRESDKLKLDPANNLNTSGQPIMMDESEDEDMSNDNWNSKNATIYESGVLDPCGRLPLEVNKAPPHADSSPPTGAHVNWGNVKSIHTLEKGGNGGPM